MRLSRVSSGDADAILAFWPASEGCGAHGFESKEGFQDFMARNPGLSFKVIDGEEIIGTGIFGRDGRRGYIHHLAVKEGYSRKRIGKVLVDRSLKELQALGVRKCRLFIATEDADSVELRRSIEWTEGTDFMLFSHDIEYPSPS